MSQKIRNKLLHSCSSSRSDLPTVRNVFFLQKSRDSPLRFPKLWFSFPTLVRMHATTLCPVLYGIYRPAIISFSLYLGVLSSFISWDKLTKSFCSAMPITPLKLKSFFNKLVWFQVSKLSEGRHICHACGSSKSTCVCPINCHILHPLVIVTLVGWSEHYFLAAP